MGRRTRALESPIALPIELPGELLDILETVRRELDDGGDIEGSVRILLAADALATPRASRLQAAADRLALQNPIRWRRVASVIRGVQRLGLRSTRSTQCNSCA